MFNGYTVSCVIPCYNEEAGIVQTIQQLPDFIDEILVVDNASGDRTAEVAAQAGARVVYEGRQGYGRAYKTGFAYATGDVLVTMDGDATYPAAAIPKLVEAVCVEGNDFVTAGRLPLDLTKSFNNIQRYFGNMALTGIVRLLYGIHIQDSQSGMWCLRRSLLDKIILSSDGMAFSEELKIKCFFHPDIRAREELIRFHYHDRLGASKLHLWGDGLRNVGYLFYLRFASPHLAFRH